MGGPRERKPLLSSRGLLPVDDFCRSTGLDRAAVEGLLRSGRVEGVLDDHGRALGLFDDVLPTAEQLRSLGQPVSDAYDPEQMRGHEVES